MGNSVRDRVLEVVGRYSDLNASEIKDDAQLWDDLGIDSLDLIETVMDLEEEFGIDIADDVIDGWKTFKDVLSYLEENHEK